MHKRTISKEYICLCHGVLPEGFHVIDSPIITSTDGRRLQSYIHHAGLPSLTVVKPLAHLEHKELRGPNNAPLQFTLNWVKIHTGRTHQIRVHLQSLLDASGQPHCLVSDDKYGNGLQVDDFQWCRRLFLHQHRLSFRDLNDVPQSFVSPLRTDLLNALRHLRVIRSVNKAWHPLRDFLLLDQDQQAQQIAQQQARREEGTPTNASTTTGGSSGAPSSSSATVSYSRVLVSSGGGGGGGGGGSTARRFNNNSNSNNNGGDSGRSGGGGLCASAGDWGSHLSSSGGLKIHGETTRGSKGENRRTAGNEKRSFSTTSSPGRGNGKGGKGSKPGEPESSTTRACPPLLERLEISLTLTHTEQQAYDAACRAMQQHNQEYRRTVAASRCCFGPAGSTSSGSSGSLGAGPVVSAYGLSGSGGGAGTGVVVGGGGGSASVGFPTKTAASNTGAASALYGGPPLIKMNTSVKGNSTGNSAPLVPVLPPVSSAMLVGGGTVSSAHYSSSGHCALMHKGVLGTPAGPVAGSGSRQQQASRSGSSGSASTPTSNCSASMGTASHTSSSTSSPVAAPSSKLSGSGFGILSSSDQNAIQRTSENSSNHEIASEGSQTNRCRTPLSPLASDGRKSTHPTTRRAGFGSCSPSKRAVTGGAGSGGGESPGVRREEGESRSEGRGSSPSESGEEVLTSLESSGSSLGVPSSTATRASASQRKSSSPSSLSGHASIAPLQAPSQGSEAHGRGAGGTAGLSTSPGQSQSKSILGAGGNGRYGSNGTPPPSRSPAFAGRLRQGGGGVGERSGTQSWSTSSSNTNPSIKYSSGSGCFSSSSSGMKSSHPAISVTSSPSSGISYSKSSKSLTLTRGTGRSFFSVSLDAMVLGSANRHRLSGSSTSTASFGGGGGGNTTASKGPRGEDQRKEEKRASRHAGGRSRAGSDFFSLTRSSGISAADSRDEGGGGRAEGRSSGNTASTATSINRGLDRAGVLNERRTGGVGVARVFRAGAGGPPRQLYKEVLVKSKEDADECS